MTDIVRYSPFPVARAERETNRLIQRHQLAAAEQAARIDGVALVTEVAMQRVAQLAAVESVLIQAVPLAEARLRTIGDSGAVGMALIVQQAVRSI